MSSTVNEFAFVTIAPVPSSLSNVHSISMSFTRSHFSMICPTMIIYDHFFIVSVRHEVLGACCVANQVFPIYNSCKTIGYNLQFSILKFILTIKSCVCSLPFSVDLESTY